jgi:hypothetical protein
MDRSLLISSEPLEGSYAWMSCTDQQLPNVSNAINVMDVAKEVSVISKACRQIDDGEVSDVSASLQPLIVQLLSLEKRIVNWRSHLPVEWMPSKLGISFPLVSKLEWLTTPNIRIYHDLWVVGFSSISYCFFPHIFRLTNGTGIMHHTSSYWNLSCMPYLTQRPLWPLMILLKG